MLKTKFTFELLQSLFNDSGTNLMCDYSNVVLTRDTRIIGKCVNCEKVFDKSFDKLYKNKNFGCDICTKTIKFERIKNTMKLKYGVEYASQLEQFKNKMKSTTLKKYGCEHALQNEDVCNKIKATNLRKYGTLYGLQNEHIKQKIINTNLEKYGFKNNTQRNEIKQQIKQTNLKKYGVEYPAQCPEIFDKMIKHMYKHKKYELPSGKVIKIQGYEHFAIKECLLQGIDETNIITGCSNVPVIWYIDKFGKQRRHFVDIYIQNQNLCIEVKSTWTVKLHSENIKLKQQYAQKIGYNYEIWVYDGNGHKVHGVI